MKAKTKRGIILFILFVLLMTPIIYGTITIFDGNYGALQILGVLFYIVLISHILVTYEDRLADKIPDEKTSVTIKDNAGKEIVMTYEEFKKWNPTEEEDEV